MRVTLFRYTADNELLLSLRAPGNPDAGNLRQNKRIARKQQPAEKRKILDRTKTLLYNTLQ